ncbi:Swt1 family HEPN domain-containing protein [Magnetospira sp. QH-2]|uniref:Swt1 family HEPN domain-containing protein n=1 Tax=Magnetospira sp. (strain QH-2) TaxID=1288970 RepID=UPI0003E80F6B|nr:Swt1 family HEPN domain-containing protein [Magnetospira sp. QH-2]CCQ74234.1 Protein of unknown function [Magnetospira sp. QH-2]
MSKRITDIANDLNTAQKALKVLEAHSGLGKFSRIMDGHSATARILTKEVERHKSMMRLMEGPLASLERSGALSAMAKINRDMAPLKGAMAAFEAQFKLPDVTEQIRLLSSYQNSGVFRRLAEQQKQFASIQQTMQEMKTPWLEISNAVHSVNGLAQLQVIGQTVARFKSFDVNIAAGLRVELGDWRDPITWSDESLTDYEERAEHYEELGFNPDLTNFPAEAFEEAIDLAGLTTDRPQLIDLYGNPVSTDSDQYGEDEFARTNRAHDWLTRMEMNLRRFIHRAMTAQYGDDWPDRRLPNGLADKWKEKQEKARNNRREIQPLIAYADFTDYELIICKRDNWGDVFSTIFHRPENVRESFQRLYPVRVDTMHSRLITQDDELFLFVEIKRLMNAIGGN